MTRLRKLIVPEERRHWEYTILAYHHIIMMLNYMSDFTQKHTLSKLLYGMEGIL